MIWYDMIWYDMIWYDMIWYDKKYRQSVLSEEWHVTLEGTMIMLMMEVYISNNVHSGSVINPSVVLISGIHH